MRVIRHLVMSLAATAVLAACGGGGGDSPVTSDPTAPGNPIAALEAAGKIPKLERTASPKGVDANANGVRDDIEAIIAAKYQSPKQKAAVMQYARAYQAIFDLPEGDKQAAKQVKLLGSRGLVCVYSRFDSVNTATNPAVVSDEIVAMTFNTKARMNVYMQYNKALNGSVWSLPQGDTCEE